MGNADYLDAKMAHDRQLSGLEFLSDIDTREELLKNKNIRKFCFVRNPYSRVLAAYLDKFEPFVTGKLAREASPYFYRMYEDINEFRLQNMPEEKKVNFFVFLQWIRLSNNIQANNEHWAPQVDLLQLHTTKYNYIGKFENIENDAQHLLNSMAVDLEFPTQDKIQFAPTRASEKVGLYCTDRESQIIKAIYSLDFRLLNYSISPSN